MRSTSLLNVSGVSRSGAFLSGLSMLVCALLTAPACAGGGCRSANPVTRVTEVWVPRADEVSVRSTAACPERPRTATTITAVAPFATACVPVQTLVPEMVTVPTVQTVYQRQIQLQTQQQVNLVPVQRTVMTAVSVPVQTYEQRVGMQRVARVVQVPVDRPVTSQCQCVTNSPGAASAIAVSPPGTTLVRTYESRVQWVDQPVTYQVPVTRQVTAYQPVTVTEHQPVTATIQVPVAVVVPVQQVVPVQAIQYRAVTTLR